MFMTKIQFSKYIRNLEHRPEKAISVVDSLFGGFLGHFSQNNIPDAS